MHTAHHDIALIFFLALALGTAWLLMHSTAQPPKPPK
jgi:hypothetical protein